MKKKIVMCGFHRVAQRVAIKFKKDFSVPMIAEFNYTRGEFKNADFVETKTKA